MIHEASTATTPSASPKLQRLVDLERQVCDVVSQQLGIPRAMLSPSLRLTQDLSIDSLDIVELFMAIEETFVVTLPYDVPNPVYKAVFTRPSFRLGDLAELVYLQQGTGNPERLGWRQPRTTAAVTSPFTQLDGRWHSDDRKLFEALTGDGGCRQYRRRSDGMRCILVPSASVEIGSNAAYALADERPKHIVELDSFVIDAEPVSTTAYCRFLNSIGEVCPEVLADWLVLDEQDDRNRHMLVTMADGEWQPLSGAERWPMMLVSWFGANAYSLWANDKNWMDYRHEDRFLPTEAQWEYAARGKDYRSFPWGNDDPSQELMRFGQHYQAATYSADTLPMAAVNERVGMSPFGLHHMAGNVWQWCQDWYDENFYSKKGATKPNPVNKTPTGVRSERGGSWVGPAELCRSSFRRGRPPIVRGRCLGFRCISNV